MKITDARFIKSCHTPADYPPDTLPEFAFLGRSNVGKSSLINMLTGRKGLVRTGSTPGVTQAVNFFVINNRFSIADLPGFGFAKVPPAIRRQFIPMIKSYITARSNLKLAFLLMDIRREPGELEAQILELLSVKHIPTVITLTKCDSVSNNVRLNNLRRYMKVMELDEQAFYCTSAKSSMGRKEILALMNQHLAGNQSKEESVED